MTKNVQAGVPLDIAGKISLNRALMGRDSIITRTHDTYLIYSPENKRMSGVLVAEVRSLKKRDSGHEKN